MKTLYVLGAGASRGHGVNKYPKPPTVWEFFHHRFISKLREEYGPLWDVLYSSIEHTRIALSSVNIEQLFAVIEPIWELSVTPNLSIDSEKKWEFTDLLSPLDILRSWVVDVIHVSTRWIRIQDCPLHSILAERAVQRNESIISFNYDLIMDVALARTEKWHIGNGYGWHSNYYVAELLSGAEFSSTLLLKPHGSLNWFAWPPRIDDPYGKEDVNDKECQIRYLDVRAPVPEMILFKQETPCSSPPFVAPKLTKLVTQLSNLSAEKRKQMEGFIRESGVHYPKKIAFARDLPYLVMPTPYKSISTMRYGELKLVWQAIPKAVKSANRAVSIGFTFCDPHFNSILMEATKSFKRPLPLVIVDPSSTAIEGIKERLQGINVVIKPFCGSFQDYVKTHWK